MIESRRCFNSEARDTKLEEQVRFFLNLKRVTDEECAALAEKISALREEISKLEHDAGAKSGVHQSRFSLEDKENQVNGLVQPNGAWKQKNRPSDRQNLVPGDKVRNAAAFSGSKQLDKLKSNASIPFSVIRESLNELADDSRQQSFSACNVPPDRRNCPPPTAAGNFPFQNL